MSRGIWVTAMALALACAPAAWAAHDGHTDETTYVVDPCMDTSPPAGVFLVSVDDEAGAEKGSRSGRYWARTSDLRLVEAALSQLS